MKLLNKYRNLIFIFLMALILIRPVLLIGKNTGNFFSRGYQSQRYESLKKSYYDSQYVNKNASGFIPDESLESFAGGIFLKGLNPILIVHDQPPLGRYIISLSILVFDNEKTIPFLLNLVSVLGIFLLALKITRNKFLSLIPLGIFINQPMYLNKFSYLPLLEPIQLPFIIFATYFFIRSVKAKNYLPYYLLTAILIGFIISIRYFVLGLTLTGSFVLFLILEKQFRKLFHFLLFLPVSLMVLLISYTRTFMSGYSLIQVLGIQKYIFLYHKSAFQQPFSFYDLLLFNRWHTWWGDYRILTDPEWSVLWPVSVVAIITSLVYLIRKKSVSSGETILLLWVVAYMVMLSVGYTSTRYFLPLVPFLYILTVSLISKILPLLNNYRNNLLR